MVNSGVYALRHRATRKVYIGSSRDFRARRKNWWHKMNTAPSSLPPALRELTMSRQDWEFIVLWDGTGATPLELEDAERRAVAQVQALAPERLLNTHGVTRAGAGGITIRGETRGLREWAAATGVPRSTISARLAVGWTPEQAVGLASRVPAVQPLVALVGVYDGGQLLSTRQAAVRLNCRIKTLQARLRRFRTASGRTQVQLSELQALSERHRYAS